MGTMMLGGRNSHIPAFPPTTEPTLNQLNRIKQLPDAFDWSNVNGVNYLPKVRSQGMCGSCYIFGSMGSLEARLNIVSNNEKKLIFSPQEVIDCSEYSQGCGGGFPYLTAGKYAMDFGIVEEQYYPYEAADRQCKKPDCQRYH